MTRILVNGIPIVITGDLSCTIISFVPNSDQKTDLLFEKQERGV